MSFGGNDADGDLIAEEIRRLELDTLSALRWAADGRIEAWVHQYLLSHKGGSTNPQFSEGLKLAPRWWVGPIELPLSEISPAVGPDPGMEYVVDVSDWDRRTRHYADRFTELTDLPPMICEYRDGELSLRDGNTRFGAMKLLRWPTAWVIVWYNSEEEHARHRDYLDRSV